MTSQTRRGVDWEAFPNKADAVAWLNNHPASENPDDVLKIEKKYFKRKKKEILKEILTRDRDKNMARLCDGIKK